MIVADRDIPEEMVETVVAEAVAEWQSHSEHVACERYGLGKHPTLEQTISRALSAALAGRTVLELPDAELDTGTIALWRPGQHDWVVIEAWADSKAIPLVRVSGSTKVAHIVRERALAMLAAADRAEQMAAEKTARAAGSGVGDQDG